MKDYQASLEKLRTDAAEAALIRDLATDPARVCGAAENSAELLEQPHLLSYVWSTVAFGGATLSLQNHWPPLK
jgi:hypothetical protein